MQTDRIETCHAWNRVSGFMKKMVLLQAYLGAGKNIDPWSRSARYAGTSTSKLPASPTHSSGSVYEAQSRCLALHRAMELIMAAQPTCSSAQLFEMLSHITALDTCIPQTETEHCNLLSVSNIHQPRINSLELRHVKSSHARTEFFLAIAATDSDI